MQSKCSAELRPITENVSVVDLARYVTPSIQSWFEFKLFSLQRPLDSVLACDGPDKDVYCRLVHH